MCCDKDNTLINAGENASLTVDGHIYGIVLSSSEELEAIEEVVKVLKEEIESVDISFNEAAKSIKSMSDAIINIKKQIEEINIEIKKLYEKSEIIQNEINEIIVSLDESKGAYYTTGVNLSQCERARLLIRINNSNYKDESLLIIFRNIDGKNNVKTSKNIIVKANSIEEMSIDDVANQYVIEFLDVSDFLQIRVFEIGSNSATYCKTIDICKAGNRGKLVRDFSGDS